MADGEDELSEPFFKGIGVAFVEVESDAEICDLCPFFHKHPPPPAPSEAIAATDNRWGVPFDVLQPACLCKVANEEEQHAFHVRCLRAFVAAQRSRFRSGAQCPMCAGWVGKDGEATEVKEGEKKTADGDEVIVEDEEVGALGGKKRKRDKQMYSLWVHVIQATGLKLVKSDKYVNPVAVISAFGKERKTKRGDNGKTYSCVWDEAFSFQKLLDEDQLGKETITIRIEHDKTVWKNDLIGQVKLNADTVHSAKDHEFYRQWTPIIHVGGKKENGAVGTQGKLQLSICVIAEKDIQNDPRLPVHIYDLEVQMWSELEQKQEVRDFDFNSSYLQNKLEQKKEQDANLISDLWDIVHIRVYKAEDLPKVDKSGWCDGYIELDYRGMQDKSKKLRSKTISKTKDPTWNHEFEVPLPADQPLFYDRLHLILRDENKFQQDVEIGRCRVNLADVLALQDNEKRPMWKTLYLDKDGDAPLYRGRILVEFSVERGVKSARMGSSNCPNVTDSSLPLTCSYQLECEVYEGIHLPGDYSEYQVDVSWGHAMLGGDSDKEREKAGRCWMTFESTKDKVSSKKMVPFLTKKTALVHNLPRVDELSRRGAPSKNVGFDEKEEKDKKDDSAEKDKKADGYWKTALTTQGFSGDGESVPTSSSTPINFNTNTLPIHPLQQLPDIIVYVSKRGARNKCVGYLRIPVEGRKRPTENWEHGEDLTIFPALCGREGEKEDNTARCFALKPLVEMYEQLCGFLLLRLQVRPVTPSSETIKMANQLVTTRLTPVPRQRYQFSVSVFQAKELASVDSSGLSSPFVSVELMDVQLRSKHRPSTTFPLWFETLEGTVELPVNLLYAPDITATVYHYKPKSVFKFRDPSIFMGKAEITAVTAESAKPSAPAWYPLQFEEHQYGAILMAFQLTPEKDVNLLPASTKKGSLDTMIDGWDVYAVDVSALAMRGPLALKFEKKKIDPVYELECWNDVQSFSQSQALKNSLTVVIRKPSNQVFYSSLNVRIYESKELVGVTSLSVDKILRTGTGWYRLVDVLMRTEERLTAKFARNWRRFVARKKQRKLEEQVKKLLAEGKDPAAELGVGKEVIAAATRSEADKPGAATPAAAAENGLASASSTAPPTDEKKKSRFDYLRQAESTASPLLLGQSPSYGTSSSMVDAVAMKRVAIDSPQTQTKEKDNTELLTERKVRSDSEEDALAAAGVKHDAKTEDVVIEIKDANVDPVKAKIAASRMLQPRQVDENGNEKIDEKQVIRLQCEQISEKDAESPWDRHWNIQCEYEMLPLTKDPFISADVFTGKDEIHQTFLEKLFARSKHSVGTLRGNFYAYPYTKKASQSGRSAPPANSARNNFDLERYAQPSQYCVRVYVLRCLQLINSKGKAADCDPFVQFQLGEGGEPQKTDVVDGSLNPKFYKCFDFPKYLLPAVDSSLTVNVFNDSGAFGPVLIGSTVIALENRLFSRQWYNGRRMTERRPLFASKRGRLPQGFVEICLDIVPQHEAGARPLDYLLNPPRREPWELRCILWNTKNVTPKKIYKHDDDCCCYDLCAPPNQSDIKLVCGFSGAKLKPQMTDIHYRSIDGEGNFNWRTLHTIELPAPEPLTYFKVQVWNINFSPDDAIAEAVMPLWGWLEFCRRAYEKNRDNKEKWVYKLPKQWVRMTHPQNTDKGDVEIELELLPSDVAAKDEYKAAAGEEGWDPKLNAPDHIIPKVKRPESSFPWYRIDKQIIWRIKYCWKKSRWILLLALLLAIAIIVGLALLKKYVF